ncbi:hypothetical protein AAZX31_20G158000 [Glycine max]
MLTCRYPCCKSRKTLISDPQFAKDHLHLRASIADPNMTHLLLVSPKYSDPSKILSFSVQSLFQNPSTPAEGRCFRLRRSCQILGSCNGLLCLFNVHTRYVKLWNPFTRLTSFQRLSICTKLLLVVTDLFETVAKVYTFGEEEYSGKRLQNFPCRPTVRLGKFVSGTLNWIAEGAVSDDRCVILSPDVGTEHMANSRSRYLGCVDDEGVCVQDSWTKLMATPNIVMPTSNPITPARDQQEICRWHFSLVLLYLSEDGVVLVKTMVSKLFLYNSNDEGFDFPRIGEEFGFNYLHLYHESLVSPRC